MTVRMRSVGYETDGTRILRDVSLHVERGDIVGLLGPNGSGKSTTLRCMIGLLSPTEGEVQLFGRPLERYARREIARRVGCIGQEASVDFDFSVREIVGMGRAPHKNWIDPESPEDRAIVEDALADVGMEPFAQRSYRTLSGGEKQRVLIARCLAQQADLLLLDEPTNHLDVKHRMALMDLLAGLGETVTLALHDLNLAAQYCDRIILLQDGTVVEQGPPDAVLTSGTVESVFDRPAIVERHPTTGRPHLFFPPDPGARSASSPAEAGGDSP